MHIIPVLDLQNNQVVHARQGRRDQYRPVNSPLCHSSDPCDVIDAFLDIQPFSILYIADLDAIGGTGNHDRLLAGLTKKYPAISFWVDRGCSGDFESNGQPQNLVPVLGSESLQEKNLKSIDTSHHFILSLDFSAAGNLGPEELFDNASCWPEAVILMTLQRMGSGAGPDLQLLSDYRSRHPEKTFIAAGGIRDARDLHKLQKIGIEHALVASALHGKRITARELAALAGN